MPQATERERRAVGDAPGGTALVVLGMHRSGTSALARCCNVLGVDLGSEFIPTRPDNQSGFWEDARIKDADDLALAALGLVWDDVRPLPPHWEQASGIGVAQERLLATLGELSRPGSPYGVKDPRISRLLPVWLPLFARLGDAPRFLVALRDPAEVAASLAKRDGLGPGRAHLLWLRYTVEAELHTRGHPRAFVCFDDLLRDWRTTMARAAERIGVAWPVRFEDAAAELDRFLDPALRHHRAAADTASRLPLACRSGEVYAALRAAEGDGSQGPLELLDRVRDELAAADLLLDPVVAELEAAVAAPGAPRAGAPATEDQDADGAPRSPHEREIDRVRRDLALAQELVRRRDEELRHAGAMLQAEQGERARLARELAASRAEVAERAREVEALRAHAAEQQAELAATREQVRAALRQLADVEGSVSWRVTAPLRAAAAAVRGGARRR